jgi:hypothetical protein
MSTRVQWRKGNTAQTATFTGAVAEITVDTDKKVIVVHDGVTAGGNPAPSLAFVQSVLGRANSAFDAANNATDTWVRNQANSAYNQANSAFDKANSATVLAQGAYDAANNVAPQIQPTYDKANNAFAQANLAYTKANSAFDYANTLYSASGGTITGNVIVTGNVTIGSYLDMNTAPAKPAYAEGRLFYDNDQKALAYYNESSMTGQLMQESVIRVYNQTGATITDGKAVYITGPSSANGFPSVALANAAIYDSSEVIGITTTVIANNGYGYVTSMGKVNGLDTHLVTEGSEVYLSDTVPGGWTTTAPASPAAPVRLGIVSVSDITDGSILVDVTFREGANKTSGAILFALDETIHEDPTNLYYDHTNHRLGIGTNTPTANLHVGGDALFTGNVEIDGNLIISNAQSISTSTLVVGGNLIVLNDTTTGTPVSNAEIRVNRGNSSNVFIKWDEQIEEWIMYEGGVYNSGHILHSEKTAKTWADYDAFPSYEKSTHPIGADLANSTNEIAKTAYNQANTGLGIALSGFAQANLAYDRANSSVQKTTDSMSGTLIASVLVANTSVTVNTNSILDSTTITTVSTAQVTLDSFATASYRSAKYLIQMTSGSSYHLQEMSVIHDDTTVYMLQYGENKTGTSLGSFDATISTGTLSLLFTPTNSSTTVKVSATLIPV